MLELDFKSFLKIASKRPYVEESYNLGWVKASCNLEWVTEDSYIIGYKLRSFNFHGEPPKFEKIEYIMRVACKIRMYKTSYLFGYIAGGGSAGNWGTVLATSNRLRWVSKDKALDTLACTSL